MTWTDFRSKLCNLVPQMIYLKALSNKNMLFISHTRLMYIKTNQKSAMKTNSEDFWSILRLRWLCFFFLFCLSIVAMTDNHSTNRLYSILTILRTSIVSASIYWGGKRAHSEVRIVSPTILVRWQINRSRCYRYFTSVSLICLFFLWP